MRTNRKYNIPLDEHEKNDLLKCRKCHDHFYRSHCIKNGKVGWYICERCYLKYGGSLERLGPERVGWFPQGLLQEYDRLDEALRIVNGDAA